MAEKEGLKRIIMFSPFEGNRTEKNRIKSHFRFFSTVFSSSELGLTPGVAPKGVSVKREKISVKKGLSLFCSSRREALLLIPGGKEQGTLSCLFTGSFIELAPNLQG